MTTAGTLSAEQARYRDRVVAATGLDRLVVTAWIGAESGWARTKASHNYLNIGPGRSYPSVDEAAGAAASLINNSPNYAGIRQAIPAGPSAQIDAIIASPWGTLPEPLRTVHAQLAGRDGNVVLTADDGPEDNLEGFLGPGADDLPGPSTGDAFGALAEALVGPFLRNFGHIMLGLIFTVAALGLIALGLARLTGRSPRELAGEIGGVVGGVGAIRGIAA